MEEYPVFVSSDIHQQHGAAVVNTAAQTQTNDVQVINLPPQFMWAPQGYVYGNNGVQYSVPFNIVPAPEAIQFDPSAPRAQ
jgi:hypothetical protein